MFFVCGHYRSPLFGKVFLLSGDVANEDTDKLVLVELFCEGDFLEQAICWYFLGAYDLVK